MARARWHSSSALRCLRRVVVHCRLLEDRRRRAGSAGTVSRRSLDCSTRAAPQRQRDRRRSRGWRSSAASRCSRSDRTTFRPCDENSELWVVDQTDGVLTQTFATEVQSTSAMLYIEAYGERAPVADDDPERRVRTRHFRARGGAVRGAAAGSARLRHAGAGLRRGGTRQRAVLGGGSTARPRMLWRQPGTPTEIDLGAPQTEDAEGAVQLSGQWQRPSARTADRCAAVPRFDVGRILRLCRARGARRQGVQRLRARRWEVTPLRPCASRVAVQVTKQQPDRERDHRIGDRGAADPAATSAALRSRARWSRRWRSRAATMRPTPSRPTTSAANRNTLPNNPTQSMLRTAVETPFRTSQERPEVEAGRRRDEVERRQPLDDQHCHHCQHQRCASRLRRQPMHQHDHAAAATAAPAIRQARRPDWRPPGGRPAPRRSAAAMLPGGARGSPARRRLIDDQPARQIDRNRDRVELRAGTAAAKRP